MTREHEAQVPDEFQPNGRESLDLSADSIGRLLQSISLAQPPCGASCGREPPSGCTVFTVSKGDRVLFGGNDDYINPVSTYWIDPGDDGEYGVIWIGTPETYSRV